jgi:hypothetical protein
LKEKEEDDASADRKPNTNSSYNSSSSGSSSSEDESDSSQEDDEEHDSSREEAGERMETEPQKENRGKICSEDAMTENFESADTENFETADTENFETSEDKISTMKMTIGKSILPILCSIEGDNISGPFTNFLTKISGISTQNIPDI